MVSFCIAAACAAAGPAPAAAADPPTVDPNTACATGFSAIRIDGDPNAVIVVAEDLPGSLSGTITAYGRETMWSGTIGRAAETERLGAREASLIVRAEGPIEGVEFTPSWATCTFHAGTRARYRSERRADDIQRPELVASNPQPAEPATCSVPYVSTAVLHAFEPDMPREPIVGTVKVAVALDEQGVPRYTRVVSSPGIALNAPSVNAALRSRYVAAVFRCKPVTSGYEFSVAFVG